MAVAAGQADRASECADQRACAGSCGRAEYRMAADHRAARPAAAGYHAAEAFQDAFKTAQRDVNRRQRHSGQFSHGDVELGHRGSRILHGAPGLIISGKIAIRVEEFGRASQFIKIANLILHLRVRQHGHSAGALRTEGSATVARPILGRHALHALAGSLEHLQGIRTAFREPGRPVLIN
jgi:hypothetical protein